MNWRNLLKISMFFTVMVLVLVYVIQLTIFIAFENGLNNGNCFYRPHYKLAIIYIFNHQ
jgi:hypothetical protein